MPPQVAVDFPAGYEYLFESHRYKGGYGGRGSSKSWSFARALILHAYHRPERVLCTRELQTSIAESVHHLLEEQIWLMQLSGFFEIQQNVIRRRPWSAGEAGSEFFFYGLKSNITKVKSTEGVTKCWVEEAEKVSHNSWEVLIPTIREPGSEIWITFNPDEENDPTYQRFVVKPPPDCVFREFNWNQNPWFPDELRREKDYLYRVDPEAAAHVWGGQVRTNLSSQIFRGKYVIESFEVPNPHVTADTWDGPYYGADWGFANDPCVLTKSWVDSSNSILYIEKESWKIGLELDDIVAYWRKDIPEVGERTIRADCSRPETISYVARTGNLPIEPTENWKGSIEDGVAYLRKFVKIVCHPRCTHHQHELRMYSYKVDRLSGDVTTDIVDKDNHCMDGLRYAHQPMIMSGGSLAVWEKLGREY